MKAALIVWALISVVWLSSHTAEVASLKAEHAREVGALELKLGATHRAAAHRRVLCDEVVNLAREVTR